MSKKLYLVFFLLIAATTLVAQTYNFANYNVGEGLEQSDILCLKQANNGYLLYGSNGGGLGYYDGYHFSAIKEKNGLANNVVFSISIDNNDNVWCATNDGISQLSPALKTVKQPIGSGTPFYCSFYSTALNIIYFGTGSGIYYYDNTSDTLVKFESSNNTLNSAFINSIYTDSENNLWIATRQNGLFKINKESVINFTESNGMPSNYIKTIIETENKIWVGTLNGLALIEKDTISDFKLPHDEVAKLTITSSSKYKEELVFGAMSSHLYFVNPKTNSVRALNQNNGFIYNKVWTVTTDLENNLWIGSIGQGIVKLKPVFNYFNQNNGLLSNYISAIYSDRNETWLGIKGKGINIIKNNKVVKTITSEELGKSIVNKITKINKDIYIGTNYGLIIYDRTTYNQIPYSEEKQNDVYAIYQGKNDVFVGTKFGLYKLTSDTLREVKGTPKDFIFDITTYQGQLYLASNKGYYIYDGSGFEFISESGDFNAGRVRSFVVNNDLLWIGTNEGVFVKNGATHFKINEDNGLSSDNVYFLKKDKKGNVWTGTNKGVDRINIASVIKSFEDSLLEPAIRGYSNSEGMQGVECNLNAVEIDGDGRLWIGTIDGVYIYNQKEDKVNLIPPNIILNNIKLNFETVDWLKYTDSINDLGLPKNLELSHKNNNLIFEYVGVSLKNPEKVMYQYQLEGLDEKWWPLTKDRKAIYTALSPGEYTFKLKAKNNDGVWTTTPTTFSFSILPPWYQTKLFYVLSVLFLLLIFYLIIYLRTKNLRKTQEELTKKVDERTKELRYEKEKVELVNTELGEQKKVIEIVNKNITDSINYAKKIQDAILPHPIKLGSCIDNIGTLYMPKDVVSGDFYWFEKIGNLLILAVSDCTGHGVPGAFMSMIGVNNLNQIILEKNITNPSIILSELNKAIKAVLQQEDVGSESRDGMDISICCFDLETKKVQYAGAFRPLIYIRNNELHEIKGSRNPIGGNAPLGFVYELNEMDFLANDVFYMFSDGYPDQFGGPKGKKFMNKRLKQVFMNIYTKTPQQQKDILKSELLSWMGEEEQIDDVLAMCIKL